MDFTWPRMNIQKWWHQKQVLRLIAWPEEELKDITDGKALFEFITAPFRGYVIYVDVYARARGVVCRGQMGNIASLKRNAGNDQKGRIGVWHLCA